MQCLANDRNTPGSKRTAAPDITSHAGQLKHLVEQHAATPDDWPDLYGMQEVGDFSKLISSFVKEVFRTI
jgi:hypothetical protein